MLYKVCTNSVWPLKNACNGHMKEMISPGRRLENRLPKRGKDKHVKTNNAIWKRLVYFCRSVHKYECCLTFFNISGTTLNSLLYRGKYNIGSMTQHPLSKSSCSSRSVPCTNVEFKDLRCLSKLYCLKFFFDLCFFFSSSCHFLKNWFLFHGYISLCQWNILKLILILLWFQKVLYIWKKSKERATLPVCISFH